MKLKHLIDKTDGQILSLKNTVPDYSLLDIKGLSLDSRNTKKGDMFFCLPGFRYDGSQFIAQACKNGAQAVVVDKGIKSKFPKGILVIKVRDVRKFLGVVADNFYGRPLARMNSIAVTGTNGKTSVTFIIENILKAYKKQPGVIGTINYRFANNKFSALNTTPDILTVYAFIDKLRKRNIKNIIMEVSSHALAQGRIEGLRFSQAIFTNLSQDHFDYHKTKTRYFAAKSKLFTDYLKQGATAIINLDDAYGRKLIDLTNKAKGIQLFTYGIIRKADIMAKNIYLRTEGSRFTICLKKKSFEVSTNLIGLFNVYNILAAVGSCLKSRVPIEYIRKGVKNIVIPGRLELISNLEKVRIFIDYAHTEDALRKTLSSLKELGSHARIIVVFGCGGNRDRDKRHKMGRVAEELADFIIITSDNPRFERPEKIIQEVKSGIRSKDCLSIVDRRAAIEKAIDMAKSRDIILIAGKGHEDYQIIKDKRISFNDRVVVKEILSRKKARVCLN